MGWPAGSQGGRAATCSPGTAAEKLPGKFLRTLRRGDVFRLEIAGAGGWGDPLVRDPARVLADVRNELVSREAAERDYGVVLDATGQAVDEAATERRRSDLRSARGWTTTKLRPQPRERKARVLEQEALGIGFGVAVRRDRLGVLGPHDDERLGIVKRYRSDPVEIMVPAIVVRMPSPVSLS